MRIRIEKIALTYLSSLSGVDHRTLSSETHIVSYINEKSRLGHVHSAAQGRI